MPKQAIVTPESVYAAADALVEAGRQPSQRSVRERIGGGSLSTIGPILRSWWEARGGHPGAREPGRGDAGSAGLPPQLAAKVFRLNQATDDLVATFQQVSRAGAGEEAGEFAGGAVQATGASTGALIEEVGRLRRMAEEEIVRLREERDRLREALQAAQREIEALVEQRNRFRDHVEALTMRLA